MRRFAFQGEEFNVRSVLRLSAPPSSFDLFMCFRPVSQLTARMLELVKVLGSFGYPLNIRQLSDILQWESVRLDEGWYRESL